MASDSTSIDDLPGSTNSEQKNRVVLEKTEIANSNPPPIAPTELSSDSINKIISGLQPVKKKLLNIYVRGKRPAVNKYKNYIFSTVMILILEISMFYNDFLIAETTLFGDIAK